MERVNKLLTSCYEIVRGMSLLDKDMILEFENEIKQVEKLLQNYEKYESILTEFRHLKNIEKTETIKEFREKIRKLLDVEVIQIFQDYTSLSQDDIKFVIEEYHKANNIRKPIEYFYSSQLLNFAYRNPYQLYLNNYKWMLERQLSKLKSISNLSYSNGIMFMKKLKDKYVVYSFDGDDTKLTIKFYQSII